MRTNAQATRVGEFGEFGELEKDREGEKKTRPHIHSLQADTIACMHRQTPCLPGEGEPDARGEFSNATKDAIKSSLLESLNSPNCIDVTELLLR
jgi:hypothetical protein